MKKLILLTIVLFNFINTTYAFSDTQTHWAKEYIEWGAYEEILNGYEDNTFRPDENVKVNEFLKIMVEASRYKKEHVGNRWPDWYIATAKKYNWIDENQFESYEKNITRDEAVKIISKYINLKTVNKSTIRLKDLNKNNKENVLKLISLGVISGYEDNTFKGDKTITRAEAIKIIKEAVNARQEVLNSSKYNISDNLSYTNVGKENRLSLYKNRYEIKNNKLYFYDIGRYAILDKHTLDNIYINESKIINLIKVLVSEDTYTSVNYVPDEDTINQLVISYGDREDYMYNGSERFSFTFYENDFYRLKDITKQERFSNECFLKIKITKLWVWKSELKNGTFINNYKFEKLERSIQTLLGKETSKEFMPYIKQKVIEGQLRGQDEKIVETKEIGNYIINTYAHEGARVEFYISEK